MTTEPDTCDRARLLSAARDLSLKGKISEAHLLLQDLLQTSDHSSERACILNDLAVLNAYSSDYTRANVMWAEAASLDPTLQEPRFNVDFVEQFMRNRCITDDQTYWEKSFTVRVAIISMLFNWPSTGGGTVHTVELGRFLQRAGYSVTHIFVRYENWGIGRCSEDLDVPIIVLEFDEGSWSLSHVQEQFRKAVDSVDADYVIITDSWNTKPLLAEAVSHRPYILRYQALENICPLNNVRLLNVTSDGATQCYRHQFAEPKHCWDCCHKRHKLSGWLHRVEREFAKVGTDVYDVILRKALRGATAILVVNPLMHAIFGAYNDNVHVIPAGMDPHRFNIGTASDRAQADSPTSLKILFAGLVDEAMKGFHVLLAACDQLWHRRQDFEIIVTGEPGRHEAPYLRFVGWLSQLNLVDQLSNCDLLVFPTIAQEALGRTAVEAMASGKPVIASDIGGLSYTVIDGRTGLLARPGDPQDLAKQIERLLDDEPLRLYFGREGRKVFEERYSWPDVIERHYRPLLRARRQSKI